MLFRPAFALSIEQGNGTADHLMPLGYLFPISRPREERGIPHLNKVWVAVDFSSLTLKDMERLVASGYAGRRLNEDVKPDRKMNF